MEFLEVYNPAFVDLMVKDGKFNLLSLLLGSLMNGQSIINIAKEYLEIYWENFRKKENWEDQKKKWSKKTRVNFEDKVSWAENVTMKEFFEITDIEFTCTSVDVKNHILRFFNHKTTPDLPVKMAVLMTGSFPVAFESQKWKPEWGKYYVHYSNTRKEITLDGINFTDGGMLANFPVKFLDNEKMRPMYFSFIKNDKTSFYGFGLNQLAQDPNPEIDLKKKKLS